MGRKNRYLHSGLPHEICIRTKEGLPFPCWLVVTLLLKSAMARAAREARVTICHFLWMANHLHLLVVVRDAKQCELFYGELQKKITDYVKRLMGVSHLSLWEGRPEVAPILDSDKVIEQIGYYYLNPARAHLEESIRNYPGFSSWEAFEKVQSCQDTIVQKVPFIRCPTIKRLSADKIAKSLDLALTKSLEAQASEIEELVIEPNAWAKCFELTQEELEGANATIHETINNTEALLCQQRRKAGRKVIGAQRLCAEQFQKPHIPKKRGRKIFVLSSVEKLRVGFIEMLEELCDKCRELYAKRQFHLWPPGMFLPPAPPLASAWGDFEFEP
jgi:REP element-mobilizing transposase RayT